MVGNLTSSARSLASGTLAVPRQLHAAYATFVTKNSSSVSQIESALRSLTYLLPSAAPNTTDSALTSANGTSIPILPRSSSAARRSLLSTELASELVYSITQLLSLYHNHLLRRSLNFLPDSRIPKPTLHSRYTKYWTSRSPLYARLATVLQCIQYTELLWEMVAKRRGGESSRWRIVVVLESLKAILRLVLMRLTKGRPTLDPPLPEREEPLPELEGEMNGLTKEEILSAEFPEWDEEKEANGHVVTNGGLSEGHLEKANGHLIGNGKPKEYSHALPHTETDNSAEIPCPDESNTNEASLEHLYNMPRTSQCLDPLPTCASDSITSYLLMHALNPKDLKPAQKLLSSLSTTPAVASELLHILRPVIYAMLLKRFASQKGSKKALADWRPWLLGVTMEFVSFRLANVSQSNTTSWPTIRTDDLAAEEMRKRQTAALWWLLRGAAWEGLTKRWVGGLSGGLKKWPLLDLLGGVIEEYEFLWEGYYFATASS
ncbi:MAG: hypothetical protein Q9227_004673 [Pyrenula ochraceoflavens]